VSLYRICHPEAQACGGYGLFQHWIMKKNPDYLHASQHSYRRLFESAKGGIIIQDFHTGTIRDVNPAMLDLLGYSLEELVGKKFWELEQIIDIKCAHDIFNELHSSHYHYLSDLSLRNKKKEVMSFDFTSRAYDMGSEKIIQSNFTDISAQKLWSKILDQSELRYRRLFEAAQDGILILDYVSGKIVDANPYISNLMGYSLDEMVGKELWEIGFVVDKEIAKKAYIELQTKSYIRYTNIPLQHKLGQILDIEFISNVYRVRDEKVIQCNIRNISDQIKLKKYEKAILTGNQQMVRTLVAITEIRDPYTAGHQSRVAELSVAIGKEFQLPQKTIEGLYMCSILHDIGKFNIPAEILTKRATLTESEKETLRNHAKNGYDILKDISFPWPIAQTVLQHHERLDGSGYPEGLKDDYISEEAKIIAVADTVEAMTGARPYRPAYGIDVALTYIQQESCILFDPEVVAVCLTLFHEKKFTFSERAIAETEITPIDWSGQGDAIHGRL